MRLFFTRLFVSERKQIAMIADEKSPARISHRRFATSCSEMEIRMKINEYQELAMTTLNPELSKRDVLINSVMGLCGESGEAIDIVKNGWLKDMNWTRNIWQRNLEM